jgi:DnaJ family protein C protein 9
MAKNAKRENHVSDEEMPSVEEDLYKILGVASDATPEAIKTAYKKSALRNHPGMQTNAGPKTPNILISEQTR